MLRKCKTCEKEFTPPRKNIFNCNKCIILKSKKQPEEAAIKEESESEKHENEESESDEQNEDEEKYGT